jgi:phosphatidylserine/phosphatidylglycerophosphate/cardiolipin synthase-like enzyme
VIGSHNISKASAISNFDTSLAVDSAALAEQVYRQFWQRWRVAVPFVADAWLR